jgi:hypothetical protein
MVIAPPPFLVLGEGAPMGGGVIHIWYSSKFGNPITGYGENRPGTGGPVVISIFENALKNT